MSDRPRSEPPPTSQRSPSSSDIPSPLSENSERELVQNAPLLALIQAGIAEGIAALGDTRDDVEVLLLVDAKGQRQTTRFLDYVATRAVEAARRLLAERASVLDRFAIVQRGEVPFGAVRGASEATPVPRVPAVLVDAADVAMRTCVRYAQRVAITTRGVIADGAPIPLGWLPSPLDAARAIIVECQSCKAKNRVPLSRIKDVAPRCGGCKGSLAA